MEPIMMHLNGGLNLEKLKCLRKIKFKNIGLSHILSRNCRLDFTTQTNGRKKIQRVPR